MNFLARRDFEQKERGEDKYEKEQALFNRAFNVTIRVQNRQELCAEKRV